MLAEVGGEVAALGDVAGEAEEEVGEVVAGGVGGDGAAGGLAEEGAGGLTVLIVVGVLAVERVDIEDFGADGEELVAGFDGVATADEGVVELRVEGSGVLELGVGGLATEGGAAEAGDDLGGEAAGEAGGEAEDAVLFGDIDAAEVGRGFAAEDVGEAEAGFEDGTGGEGPRVADGGLLLDGVDEAGVVAAGRTGVEGAEEADVFALAEAGEGGFVAAQLVVEFGVVFITLIGDGDGGLEVVGAPGGDGGGEAGEGGGGEGVDLGERDFGVGGVDCAGEGVDDGDGEDSLTVIEAGHGVEVDEALGLADTFVIDEEEEFVFDERAAEGCAELVAVEGGFAGGGLEVAGGVEVGIAEEFEDGAVELIGAGAHDGVDDAAADAAVFGAEVTGDDAEFGKGVGGGLDDLAGVVLVAGAVRVVVEAIHEEVVEGAAHAVDVEGAFAGRGGGGEGDGDGRDVDVGGEEGEAGVLATVEGEFGHGLRADDLGVFGGIGIDEAGLTADGDGVGDVADLKDGVDTLAGVDGDVDIGGGEAGEAGEFDGDGVVADADIEEVVVAGVVCGGFGFDVGVLIGEGDGGFGDGLAGGVTNGAEDLRVFELGEAGEGEKAEEGEEGEAGTHDGFTHTARMAFEIYDGMTDGLRFGYVVKKLTKHGNSLALAIDRPILELLNIDPDTLLDISTDGKQLIVAPAKQSARRKKFEAAQELAHERYAKAFQKLAQQAEKTVMEPLFLSLDEVLEMHEEQIERYGGAHGLRDTAGLE